MAVRGADITLGFLLRHVMKEKQELQLAIAVERGATLLLLNRLIEDPGLRPANYVAMRAYVDRLEPFN